MREIKFKAWDKVDKKIREVAEIHFKINGSIHYVVLIKRITLSKGEVRSTYLNRYLHEVEFLQYTGLKDKNGKKIYEGDIVRNGFGEKAIIEYITEIASFRLSGGKDNFELSKSWADGINVIGNKYDNPELLQNRE